VKAISGATAASWNASFWRAGTGVFLNPQGVLSAASFAPAGNPIAPGEFIALVRNGPRAEHADRATALSHFPQRRDRDDQRTAHAALLRERAADQLPGAVCDDRIHSIDRYAERRQLEQR